MYIKLVYDSNVTLINTKLLGKASLHGGHGGEGGAQCGSLPEELAHGEDR